MLINYINANQLEIAIITVITVVVICYMVHKNKRSKQIFCLLSALYILAILYKTLSTRHRSIYEINFELFWSYKAALAGNKGIAEQIILNIFLYIPFGCLTGSIIQKKISYIWMMIVGIMLSLFVEYMQYKFQIGLFELDDIFSNTLGTIFGLIIADIVKSMVFRTMRKRSE